MNDGMNEHANFGALVREPGFLGVSNSLVGAAFCFIHREVFNDYPSSLVENWSHDCSKHDQKLVDDFADFLFYESIDFL